jgi:hypothetical protein
MSRHGKFLKSYQRIFSAMQKIEEQYKVIEELDGEVEHDHKLGYDAYADFISNIEKTIDYTLLSPSEREEFDQLIMTAFHQLKRFPFKLYDDRGSINAIIHDGIQAADDACANYMLKHADQDFFACGYSNISIPVRRHSLLGLIMENQQEEGVYKFTSGQLEIDFGRIFSRYAINSQSYEVREIAYRAALAIINSKLRLKGVVEAWID